MLNRGVINKVVELLHKKKRAKLLSKRNKNRKSGNGKKPSRSLTIKILLKRKGVNNRC